MGWRHPQVLAVIPALPALAVLYVTALRRAPARLAVRFPSSLLQATASRGRHAGAVALGAALLASVVAAAGPVVPWRVPKGLPVALVVDVSRSMEETDILPSRIEAAKAAALEFLAGLPAATPVALVTFGNYAATVVPLTTDRDRLAQAIRTLSTQLRTQLGSGLVEAVRAVAGEGRAGEAALPTLRAAAVLLSDGRASDGVPPLEAAEVALARGVRVYIVGVATETDPARLRSGIWGVLDEPTLQAIADRTGGTYYRASDARRLREVYRDLSRVVGWTVRPVDASPAAAAAAAAFLVASLAVGARLYRIG
ncbi:MAG: VWA domain-containing protein [Armatimonadota bacterium]|nr:VWA domain-containing protein [Armatimonadota bacterium]